MSSPKTKELIDIIKKSGFYRTDATGLPINNDPAIGCIISKDLLRELANWVKEVNDVVTIYSSLLEVANWHVGEGNGGKGGGIVWSNKLVNIASSEINNPPPDGSKVA